MSDDHKRDLHTWIEPELEARIAALVLGEASAFEADELERLMAEKPELRVFKERLEEVHGHLQDAVKPQDNSRWRLSSQRREELMEKLGMEPEEDDEVVPLAGGEQRRESRIRRQGLKVAVMAAACLMISLLLAPFFFKAERKGAESTLSLMLASEERESVKQSKVVDRAPEASIVAERMPMEESNIDLAGVEAAGNRASGRGRGASATLDALRENLDRAVVPEEAPADVSGGWSGFRGESERRDARPGNGAGVLPDAAAPKLLPPALAAPQAVTKATNGPSPEPTPEPAAEPDPAGIAGSLFGEGLALGGGGGGGSNPDAPAPAAKPAARPAPQDSPDDAVADLNADVDGGSIVEVERIRRQAGTQEAEQALLDGREAYSKGDFDSAVRHYREAAEQVPAGEGVEQQREAINEHLADGSVALARQHRRVGKDEEAKKVLDEALEADPDNMWALREKETLDDPIRTNPAVDFGHAAQVDEVRRGLYTGEGHENLGNYDEAEKQYKDVLKTDPYNAAARRGLERAAAAKSDYYRAAYDETRARLLAEVDEAWELAVPPVAGEPEQGRKGNDKAEVASGLFPVTPATPAGDESPFGYPTEYEPPELPNSVGTGNADGLRSGDAAVTRNSIDAILNAPQRFAGDDDKDAELSEEAIAGDVVTVSGGIFDAQAGKEGEADTRGIGYSDYLGIDLGAEQSQEQGQVTEKLQKQLGDVERNLKREVARPGEDPFADDHVHALPDTVAEVEELAEMKKVVGGPASEAEGGEVARVDGEEVWSRDFVTYARRDEAVDRALESHDYIEAKREYENAQAMLQATKLQHSTKRIGLKIPKSPITIHEKPKVSKKSGGFLGLGAATYEGKTTLQVNPNVPDLDPFGGQLGDGEKDGQLTQQFFETEFDVVVADATLKEAVEELGLEKRWKTDKEGAIKRLRERVATEQVKGTDLFSIKVTSDNESEAKEIAEKVAESYKERRTAMEEDRAEAALEALSEELRKQEDVVEEKRKVLDTIVQAIGIPYMEGVEPGMSDEALYQLGQRQLKEQEWERDQLARQIRMLSELESEELMKYAAGLALPHNGLTNRYNEYLTARRELRNLEASGLASNHPKVEALRQNVDAQGKDLEKMVESTEEILRAQLRMIDKRLERMRQTLTERSPDKSGAELEMEKKEAAAQRAAALQEMEQHTADEPFSTFSLHVSDVGFKLAQAALEQGTFPDPAKVRVEEFVNAFDYGDPMPSQDERVACRVEQAAHPFMQQRNVMRIAMRTAAVGRAAGTPLRLTILLDNSGSMDRADRAESVQRAFGLLADQLTAQDEVTLIGFARTPRLLREDVRGDEARGLLEVIAQTPSEGGTNLEEALRLGMEKAMENHLEGAQNRVILLTDGAANLGDAEPERLSKLVEDLRQRGVAFDACGVGAEGFNDTILEALTRKGDGRYYFLDRPEDADAGFAKQIAGALRPAAKNVKVQVEFNPKRVGHYALYGFEKHELKKEDFRNDSVDAAELAAEEAGVALYHFEAMPDGEGDIGTVSVRFQDTATGEMVEQLWPIPYEASPDSVEDAEPSLRLAATAAFLGEALKGSAVGSLVEFPELGRWSRSLQTVYPQSERIDQLVQMIEKVRELSGR